LLFALVQVNRRHWLEELAEKSRPALETV